MSQKWAWKKSYKLELCTTAPIRAHSSICCEHKTRKIPKFKAKGKCFKSEPSMIQTWMRISALVFLSLSGSVINVWLFITARESHKIWDGLYWMCCENCSSRFCPCSQEFWFPNKCFLFLSVAAESLNECWCYCCVNAICFPFLLLVQEKPDAAVPKGSTLWCDKDHNLCFSDGTS